jgi:hypothetical protein
MLYEKIIPINTSDCIELSETYRLAEESDKAVDKLSYLTKLRGMMSLIPKIPLKRIPLFEWHGVSSTCWKFEEYRAMSNVYDALMNEAKDCHGEKKYKETKGIITIAYELCKEMSNMNWERTPFVFSMPEFQPEFQMSKIFFTRALHCYNIHSFKANHQVIRIAYQLAEISNKLWNPTANDDFEKKMLAEYYYMQAGRSEFKNKLSYITAAYNLVELPHIVEMYNEAIRLNETVHYESVIPVECPLLTVEQALAKC